MTDDPTAAKATKQFMLTPAASKRLIAKAMVHHPAVQGVLKKGTLVIVAGTTNGYVAEEILASINQLDSFTRKGFVRGAVYGPGFKPTGKFGGDVVIVDGVWQKDAPKTIFDVVDGLKSCDLILKGANALDMLTGRAGVLIGDPKCGTAGAAIPAVVGRRVQMIIPVGLEKRVSGNLNQIASLVNDQNTEGPRLLLLPGQVFTELDAIAQLTGASAQLVAAGGVCGAEGIVWLAVQGNAQQLEAAKILIQSVATEPPCQP